MDDLEAVELDQAEDFESGGREALIAQLESGFRAPAAVVAKVKEAPAAKAAKTAPVAEEAEPDEDADAEPEEDTKVASASALADAAKAKTAAIQSFSDAKKRLDEDRSKLEDFRKSVEAEKAEIDELKAKDAIGLSAIWEDMDNIEKFSVEERVKIAQMLIFSVDPDKATPQHMQLLNERKMAKEQSKLAERDKQIRERYEAHLQEMARMHEESDRVSQTSTALAEYRTGVLGVVEAADEKYPHFAAYFESAEERAEAVMRAATYIADNDLDDDLDPEALVAKIEAEFAAHAAKLSKTQKGAKKTGKNTRTINMPDVEDDSREAQIARLAAQYG